jgi:hypothetical protein
MEDPDLQQFNSRPRDSVTYSYRLVPDVIQPDLPRARQLTTPKDGTVQILTMTERGEKMTNRDEMRGAPSPRPIRAYFSRRYCVSLSP